MTPNAPARVFYLDHEERKTIVKGDTTLDPSGFVLIRNPQRYDEDSHSWFDTEVVMTAVPREDVHDIEWLRE